jgi:uroporphyrinogen decarboxylase
VSSAARRVYGVTYAEWAQNGELAAKCQLQAQELLGFDGMGAFVDLSVEAGDLGQEMVFPVDSTPHPNYDNPFIKSPDDYLKIEQVAPTKWARMKEVITCCDILMNERGSTVPVSGFVYGPLGILAMMRSVEKLLTDCIRYKDQVQKGCEIITKVLVDYVKAQAKTGVHGIVVDTLFGCQGIMSKKLWKEIEGPFTTVIADAIREAGSSVVVHNCGTGPYFDAQIETMNPVAISFAHIPADCEDMKEAKDKYGDKITLVGYVDTSRYLFLGTPGEVKEECKREIEELGNGGRFILSTGCEVPPNGSLLNVIAMMEAVELYGKYD